MRNGPKCVPAPLIISSCISSKWQHHNRYKYSSNNSLDTRVYELLEGTFLPMLPEKLHRIVYLFSDLLREVIDVLLAFKAFGQRPPDASALTQKKSFTPMALPQKKAIKNECICRCDCCDCCPC